MCVLVCVCVCVRERECVCICEKECVEGGGYCVVCVVACYGAVSCYGRVCDNLVLSLFLVLKHYLEYLLTQLISQTRSDLS